MTDLSSPGQPLPESVLESFVQNWAEILAQVLGEISGSPVSCVVLPEAPALPASAESDLYILAAASGTLRGEMSLRLPAAATVLLAQVFGGETSAATAVSAEYKEAVVELFRQVSGLIATMLRKKFGDVQLHVEAAATSPSWSASSTAWLRAGEEPSPAWIEMQLSAAIVAALRAENAEAAAAPPLTPNAAASAPPAGAQESGVNLALLKDVELAVTLRFGSRRLLLREVLELNPGAVVELDREVPEPVDLLLDNRIVARGEIVVLDGNYGLRVTEVAPV
jgi:flagellar motor switch protein FliN/FliY